MRAPLDAAAWSALRAPGSDDVIAGVFAAVERAAVAARLDELRDERKLVTLDPTDRLSESSTASIVRSFQWAARALGIASPPGLYVMDGVPGGIAAIHAREPSTAVGQSVLRGPTAKDLAFLAGRHLTYYRPEYHVLLYYPTRDDLTTLLLAAAQLAMPETIEPGAPRPVGALRARLAHRIDPKDREALEVAVRRLDERGGRVALTAWTRSVELTAGRAGLLLCGDLAAAASLLRSEARAIANLAPEAKRADLRAFCASREHAELRARFVVAAAAPAVSSARAS
jgi:hypothetical protein